MVHNKKQSLPLPPSQCARDNIMYNNEWINSVGKLFYRYYNNVFNNNIIIIYFNNKDILKNT